MAGLIRKSTAFSREASFSGVVSSGSQNRRLSRSGKSNLGNNWKTQRDTLITLGWSR